MTPLLKVDNIEVYYGMIKALKDLLLCGGL